MNLVFFDIECASVNKVTAKICAFGYVVCDENFNILKKEDILINPKGRFHLTDRKGSRGLVLPYDYSEFVNYPPFRHAYPVIKSLLEDKNNLILGHATMNDVKYLNLETRRFKLPSFSFSFSDSQILYMTMINDFSHQPGLEYIASALNVEFTPHRAADDAYATMRIVEAMCKSQGVTYRQLAEKLKVKKGRISDYKITPPTSLAERKFHEQTSKAKMEKSKIRINFFNYVCKKKVTAGRFSGKVFTFSKILEEDLPNSKKYIDGIYSKGGRYSQHTAKANIYVACENDKSARYQNAVKSGITVTDVAGLEAMLND